MSASSIRTATADTLVITRRNLLRIPRAPDLLIGFTVQPVMFVLLFVYVFGGAIQTPGYDYVDFLMPGILTQTIAFGGYLTAVGLNEDLRKGLMDRFRSLPMARSAVLAGRTLADVVMNMLAIALMLGVGYAIGFRFATSVPEILAGIALLLLFGYAFSWIFALMGLISSSPESAGSIGFLIVFPLTFVSSAFVPVESMPDALQAFAEHNPFTVVVDAVRTLFLGPPADDPVWPAVAWSVGLIAVFAPHRRLALPARLRGVGGGGGEREGGCWGDGEVCGGQGDGSRATGGTGSPTASGSGRSRRSRATRGSNAERRRQADQVPIGCQTVFSSRKAVTSSRLWPSAAPRTTRFTFSAASRSRSAPSSPMPVTSIAFTSM